MNALLPEDVARITADLTARGLHVCVDRGFGVDALLGEVTRLHRDLDLLVAPGEHAAAALALDALGFRAAHTSRDGSADHTNESGQRIDLREDGAVLEAGFITPGRLAGCTVPCVSAAHQVARRAARRVGESDLHAIETLHRRLGVPLPSGMPPLALIRTRLWLRRLARRALRRTGRAKH